MLLHLSWVAASGLLAPLALLQLRSMTRRPASGGHALAVVLALPALETVAWVFLWIALGALLTTGVGVAGSWPAGRS